MAISDIVLPVTFKSNPRGLKQAEAQLKNFGKNVGKIAAGATAAVAGIAAGSVKAFADFDEALNKSVAIMGDVSDAMRDDMAEAARTVAKETTFSAEQAAESFFFLASAGLDAKDSIAALPQVAAFAQAGAFDMATATDLLTDAQSALGLASDDTAANMENLARVSDVLVAANTNANATVQQFSESLTNKAANSMKALGIELEEGVAVLSVFADQGIKGSEAGTRFNATIRGLTKGAQDNAEAFAELGVEVFDSEGNFNNFADIISDLEGGLDGLSTEQQRVTLSQLGFTEETLAGTLALLGNSEAIAEYEQGLKDAGGTTGDVADKQLESFNAQLKLLQSAFVDVGLQIGSDLIPMLVALVEDMKPLIEEATPALTDMFRSLMPVLTDLVKGFPAFVGALIPLIPVMGDIAGLVFEAAVVLFPIFLEILNMLLPVFQFLAEALRENTALITGIVASIAALIMFGTAISKLATLISAFQVVMGALRIGTIAQAVATGAATAAQNLFNLALKANPIGLVITAVAALVAGLVFFFTQTELGRELWAQFVQFLTEATQAFVNFFVVLFTEQIPAVWATMVEGITAGWEGFKEYFFTALEAIGEFFRGIINGWISLFETFVNGMIRGVNKIINALNTVSIDIPEGVPKIGGLTFGINIPNVPEVSLPRLAEGGIVDSATIAMIGEAGPEAVIPLDKLDQGGDIYVTVNAGMGTNGPQVGEEIVAAIKRYERSSGRVFQSA